MKKIAGLLLALTLCLSTANVYAGDVTQDNALDKMSDWAQTVGKSGVEKETILAKRRADRVAMRMEKEAKKAAAKAEKDAKKMGDSMKKSLGVN